MAKRSVEKSVIAEANVTVEDAAVAEKEADTEKESVEETGETGSADIPAADYMKKKEWRYKIAKLRENCLQLFGITTSTFDGAFYGSKETEMTISEADAVIKNWLGIRKEG